MPSFERRDAILSAGFHGSRIKRGETRRGQICSSYEEARSDDGLPESAGERERRMHGFITERCSVSPVAAQYGGPLARRLIEIQTRAPLPHQSHLNFHIFFFILAKDVFQVCFRRGFRWSARWLFHLPLANHTLISPRTGRTEWNR